MPPIEAHLKTSKERTGDEYRELHEWLDSDPEHTAERHDITKIFDYGKMIEEKHGSQAVTEYIEHIRDDVRGKFSGIHDNYDENIAAALRYFGCG